MNEAGKRALAELCNTRETRRYEQHLSSSATQLRDSVGAINDALFNCQRNLAALVEKRTAQGVSEKSDLETTLEKAATELEAQVSELTERSEAALREVIDYRAELEDEKQVLQEVQQQVNAQKPRPEPKPKAPRRRRHRERDSDDDEENEDVEEEAEDVDMYAAESEVHITGVTEILRTARESKADEYSAMSAYQRYGVNNDYISFKKTWHDAQHPNDQVPLPHATTWFDELGRPTKGIVAADEDDDLVVEREIRDLKCPLSLQLMKEPYSNHKCKHTFEKSAIMDFLRTNQGVAKCPVCTEVRSLLTSGACMLHLLTLFAGTPNSRSIPRRRDVAKSQTGGKRGASE